MIKVLLGLICYCFIAVLAYLFSFGTVKFWIIVFLGASIILDSFMYFFRCLFRVKETMEYEAVLMLIEAILKFTVVLMAIKLRLNITGAIIISIAFLLSSAINFLVNLAAFWLNYGKLKFSFEIRFCLYLLQSSLPFAIIYILSLSNFRIDTIMLSMMKGDIEAGWFSADFKLIEQILLVPITFSAVILPIFSKLSGTLDYAKTFYRRIAPFLLAISLSFVTIFYFWSGIFIKIIYGEAFLGAIPFLALLSWILVPFFLKSILEKIILGIGGQVGVCVIYALGAVLNIILNLFLIPNKGVYGVCLATLISECLVFLGCMAIFYKRLSRTSLLKGGFSFEQSLSPNEVIS